jgi:RNA polymerase sigma-70 factor (ECF subfamily)
MTFINHLSVQQISEEELWIIAAKDDPSKFEPLYNRYFERVFRFVYQRMDSKESAADITSQVFLKALVNLEKYSFRGLPFFAWLCRIAISEIGNYYSRASKYKIINIETAGLNQMAESIELEATEEKLNAITECLKTLPEGDTLMIEMRFFESRSFKEIGHILNITENNAKVKLYRILDKIKMNVRGITFRP